MVDKAKLKKFLSEYDEYQVEQYATYCVKITLEKKEDQTLKNPWASKYTDEKFALLFKTVAKDGMYIDGKSISLQQRGVTYDFQAYKNRMFLAYPESKIDCALVYKDDTFSCSKKSGEVFYSHDYGNPFDRKDENIIGAYCVIKNKRGEFLTTITMEDIKKHRAKATTDKIWKEWFAKMCLKTVIKDACNLHFKDVYKHIIEIDNETNSTLENPIDLNIDLKGQIDDIDSIENLRTFYNQHKQDCQKMPALLKYIQSKQAMIKEEQNKGEK